MRAAVPQRALLRDPQGILIQQTENVQAARQIRFTSVQKIIEMEAIVKTYIQEAIEVEKAGLEVKLKQRADFSMPEELNNKFEERPGLKTAFEVLTPGQQKPYILFFSKCQKICDPSVRN